MTSELNVLWGRQCLGEFISPQKMKYTMVLDARERRRRGCLRLLWHSIGVRDGLNGLERSGEMGV